MVRLVFRPYTQLRRSICTSESLRTSIRVSPDFVLARHSSPSFGSQRVRSGCASPRSEDETPRECGPVPFRVPVPSSLGRRPLSGLHFHCAFRFSANPMTRAHVRLLGPCFKTGRETIRRRASPTGATIQSEDDRPGRGGAGAVLRTGTPPGVLPPSFLAPRTSAPGRTPHKPKCFATGGSTPLVLPSGGQPGHRESARACGGAGAFAPDTSRTRGLSFPGLQAGTQRVATFLQGRKCSPPVPELRRPCRVDASATPRATGVATRATGAIWRGHAALTHRVERESDPLRIQDFSRLPLNGFTYS